MNRRVALFLIPLAALYLSGCGIFNRNNVPPEKAQAMLDKLGPARFNLSPELARRILTLNPERVTEADLRDTLSKAPAPRIVNIHGGIAPVQNWMISFSHFLIGMGYPKSSVTNPRDGTYSF